MHEGVGNVESSLEQMENYFRVSAPFYRSVHLRMFWKFDEISTRLKLSTYNSLNGAGGTSFVLLSRTLV